MSLLRVLLLGQNMTVPAHHKGFLSYITFVTIDRTVINAYFDAFLAS